MPRFSINVSFMLTEHAFLDRFAAAADLGFTAVDIQSPYEHPPEAVAKALHSAGLTAALHNLPTGDMAARDFGPAAVPGREAEFRAAIEKALVYSRAIGNRRVNLLAGCAPPDQTPERCLEVLTGNLRFAAEAFAAEDIGVMVEPVNGRDVPGFLVQTTESALTLIEAAGGENLSVQLDLYHRQIMQGDLIPALETHLPQIGHIQFADTPGRHEPGTGEINFPRVFEAIDRLGYAGRVGAEYLPSGRLEDSLAWFRGR